MAYNIKADKNPMAINIRKLQRYNFSFFTLEEVVFFEYLVVKAPLFKFKEFYHSTSTIAKEIGIKRSKLESIITKFGRMGLLSVEVKGFPKVKHFTVNFEKIRFFLPKIYQSAENGKLSADMNKLLVDFYNPLVETYQKKNINKETINETLKKENIERDTGWLAFANNFLEKIRISKKEYHLSEADIKYDEQALYQTYKSYGDDAISYLDDFLKKNTRLAKISDFLKPDKHAVSKNAFIEEEKIQEKIDGKKLIEALSRCFNDRREMASDSKKKFSKTSLIANDVIIDKAAQALKRISENEINHAFIAYADAIIADKVQPRKILPYFFTWQYGSYSVIEEYLDHFNVNYSIRK